MRLNTIDDTGIFTLFVPSEQEHCCHYVFIIHKDNLLQRLIEKVAKVD